MASPAPESDRSKLESKTKASPPAAASSETIREAIPPPSEPQSQPQPKPQSQSQSQSQDQNQNQGQNQNQNQSQNQKQKQKQQQQQQDTAGSGSAEAEKKLSGAELKKKAKEEKAARRALAKQDKPGSGSNASSTNTSSIPSTAGQRVPAQASGGDGRGSGAKPKEKHDGQQAGQHSTPRGGGAAAAAARLAPAPVAPAQTQSEIDPQQAVPECFAHLSIAKWTSFAQADKAVHPAILVLGQQMRSFTLKDSVPRLEATLLAFKKVIHSYETPAGHSFPRHFNSHVLASQIDYLTACRPMCFAMGNGIRWLKLQVSRVDIDMSDDEAKKRLCDAIDTFLHERIELADVVLVRTAAEMISSGDRIVVFGHHGLIERAVHKAAVGEGKRFGLVVVDDPHQPIGKDFCRRAGKIAGLDVTYCADLGALRWAFEGASMFLVAAEAMFSNGALYAAAGTCDVAVAAREANVRVVSLCESISIFKHVAVDSLSYNEIDPEANDHNGFRLLFDTTPHHYLSLVATELGVTKPTSVSVVLPRIGEL